MTPTTAGTRPPAVAGLFYPGEPRVLRADLARLLDENPAAGPAPKALIAPHAGYVYSGPVAARAYNLLNASVRRVVLLGPAHRVPLRGLALPTVSAFRTPLGDVPLDLEAMLTLEALPQVLRSDEAHRLEHSLEVHLPFLQARLGEFALVPLVVGWASSADVAEVLDRLWGGPETLVVISSDLSHYHPYADAQRLDEDTARRIEALQAPLEGEQACGAYPLNGLLNLAKAKHLRITRMDLRNSGDTAGTRDRVVGYGAWALHAA
ncbi:MAG TPA: AmmeMemoRadiSam system protein B [Gammaproteobacteria bacterium]|nr:AmmeMemoRadiSam system protein B [Gammaproteobacteria bacterium]